MTATKHQKIENQIEREQSVVDYDTREFTVEYIVNKYWDGLDTSANEFFVPEYQREFVWGEKRQSKLIESIVLGLPIPSIFLAENRDGRCEIVDGSQRIRTLAAFLKDDLELERLERLGELNGVKFSDLPESRQRKIKNTALRLIFLSDSATDDVKNDLFERINKGSDLLKDMEKRKGIYRGSFIDFIYKDCATNSLFTRLAPITHWLENRQEKEELILRFFALYDLYPNYNVMTRGIARLLDEYIESKKDSFTDDEKNIKYKLFTDMLTAVEYIFEWGFAKDEKPQVSRIYFEALSVGTALAIKDNPTIILHKISATDILNDSEFYQYVSGKYKTHTKNKMVARIDYIKNRILGA